MKFKGLAMIWDLCIDFLKGSIKVHGLSSAYKEGVARAK
jgi:hypothetical protein